MGPTCITESWEFSTVVLCCQFTNVIASPLCICSRFVWPDEQDDRDAVPLHVPLLLPPRDRVHRRQVLLRDLLQGRASSVLFWVRIFAAGFRPIWFTRCEKSVQFGVSCTSHSRGQQQVVCWCSSSCVNGTQCAVTISPPQTHCYASPVSSS